MSPSTWTSRPTLHSPGSIYETIADAVLDYPVEAYICLDDNSEVENPALFTQGSTLQVCVKIDETVATDNVLAEDILTFVISQPDGTAADSKSITNTVSDPLTDKVCRESGICNVKTQLQSKFFTDTSPGDIRIDGVAIPVFGQASLMPSSAPTVGGNNGVHSFRAPIHECLHSTKMQHSIRLIKKNTQIRPWDFELSRLDPHTYFINYYQTTLT
jgi:hypothetical protein